MAHQRRYFPSGRPYFITNRLAEGLPFVANLYINLMLFGIIVRAWSRHRSAITICAFLFLANHYHMVIVLRGDPNQLKDFMNYVDGEIAKLVVRWLGKRNCKVWAQPYCAAILLTPESAFKQMVYTFANPIEAHLAATAAAWTGCSSFYSLEDNRTRSYKWVRPSLAPQLPNGRFSKQLLKSLLHEIEIVDSAKYPLEVEPFAWMDCFDDTRNRNPHEMKGKMLDELANIAKRCCKEREVAKLALADPKLLAEQNPHKIYKPKKYSRRVFCISSDKELRMAFIALYNDLCACAKVTWERTLTTFSELIVPHGMFVPPRPARGSVFSIAGFF